MTTPTPSIAVSPTDGLVDEPLDLRIEGLEPRAPVTVRAQARFSRNAGTWSTEARYTAGDDGALDLNAQAPDSGEFAVPDANALVWSLRPDDPATNARALAEGLAPYEIELTVESGETVLRETILRRPVAESVNIAEVREPDLKLNLFLPEGAGPFPVVLVLGGSGGGFPDRQAALFASHGIAAVSLAYFGVEGLPEELRQIPLEYFERALAWISNHPLLQSERLAVSGTSRGGELALILASRYPQIRSVVAYVPSSHVWGAISRIEDDLPVDEFASWTHGGRSLPYAGRVRNDAVAPDAEGTIRLAPAYLAYLNDPARAGQAVIPVERIDGPVLLISGTNDALWPSATFGNLIAERARLNGFDFEVEHLTYDGAGHAIGAGIGPTTVNRSYHPIRKAYIDLGGTPEGLAKARADSWPRVLAFVARHTSAHRLVPDEVKPGMS